MRAGQPAWLFLFAGWLWASTESQSPIALPERELDARSPVSAPEPVRRTEVEPLIGGAGADRAADLELSRMGPRELRLLPGIGQTRALAIARERWKRGDEGGAGGLADLVRIPGIGPETQKHVRQWFQRTRRAP